MSREHQYYVWVVEVNFPGSKFWEPLEICGTNREFLKQELKIFKEKYPKGYAHYKYRISKYEKDDFTPSEYL